MKTAQKSEPSPRFYNSPIDPADPLADCDHVMGGCWGNHISWLDGQAPDLSETCQPGDMVDLRIYGHQPSCFSHRPNRHLVRDGDWIAVEYSQYWLTFETYDVERDLDPNDMFLAKVRCVRACDRETGLTVWHRAEPERIAILTGTGLERAQRRSSLNISGTGYVLLVLLALALFASVFALTARAFDIAAHQRQIERV